MKIQFKLNPKKMNEYQKNFFEIFSKLEKKEISFIENRRDYFTLKKVGKISYWELNLGKLIEEAY